MVRRVRRGRPLDNIVHVTCVVKEIREVTIVL
jgi:hypothetical protein